LQLVNNSTVTDLQYLGDNMPKIFVALVDKISTHDAYNFKRSM